MRAVLTTLVVFLTAVARADEPRALFDGRSLAERVPHNTFLSTKERFGNREHTFKIRIRGAANQPAALLKVGNASEAVPLSPADEAAQFSLADGFTAELVLAESEDPANPYGKCVALAFDARGRIWRIRHAAQVVTFLDSPAGRALPVENRLLALLSLEPAVAAQTLVRMLPDLGRAPDAQEVRLLAMQASLPDVGAALEGLALAPETRVHTLTTLLAQRTSLDSKVLEPIVSRAAAALIAAGDSPADTGRAVLAAAGEDRALRAEAIAAWAASRDPAACEALVAAMADDSIEAGSLPVATDAAAQVNLDGPFTVEAWMNLDSPISNQDSLVAADGVLDMNFSGEQFRVWTKSFNDVLVARRKTVPGTWTHYAVTRDAEGVLTLYVNGELDCEATVRDTTPYRGLRIGSSTPKNAGTQGRVAEFRVWDQGGQGGKIGPALDGVGLSGVEAILRHVLTPSAAMEGGYRNFRVVTRDGRVIQDLLVSNDADAIVIRQPDVTDIRIAAKDVAQADFTGISVMPEGLLEAMQPQEVSDLVAHLKPLTVKSP